MHPQVATSPRTASIPRTLVIPTEAPPQENLVIRTQAPPQENLVIRTQAPPQETLVIPTQAPPQETLVIPTEAPPQETLVIPTEAKRSGGTPALRPCRCPCCRPLGSHSRRESASSVAVACSTHAITIVAALAILLPTLLHAQTPIPRIAHADNHFALLVDDKPFLMLGAQINNSSAWPAMLPKVWPTAERLGVNTLEVPIYWEQFEPEPGRFDPTLLQTLLDQARAHQVHLVLLWFGTWKNGSGHYIPASLKRDEARVPHVVGPDGRKIDSLSPHSEFALAADRTAFAALMRALKAADPQHTVLMVQVENEPGTYGSARDFSPAAEKLFAAQVPAELTAALHKSPGTWREVFAADADEYFHAWSIARYINAVAQAGKAEYPLPMYVNAALRNPFDPGTPGSSFESGGATDDVLTLYKVAAPSIDILAPDLYNPDYRPYTRVLDLYARPDNPMFVPETGNSPAFSRYFFAALGRGAIGFSPFGLDTTGIVNDPPGASRINETSLEPLALIYRIFGPMSREVALANFEGHLQAVSEDPTRHQQTLKFPTWTATVSYGRPTFGQGGPPAGNPTPEGGVMVAQLAPDEFLVTGIHARIDFDPVTPEGAPHLSRQFIKVEEGAYQNGIWHLTRIWNGDQTDYGLNFTSAAQVLRVTLATY